MLDDRFGLTTSTSSAPARDAYVAGVDSVISGVAGYREFLAEAIRQDPSFALASIALARGRFLDGEVVAARELAAGAREQAARRQRDPSFAAAIVFVTSVSAVMASINCSAMSISLAEMR